MGWPGDDEEYPVSERFFAGGSSTVRGFPLDDLRYRGGNGLVILNQEIRFPLYADLGGAVFADWGNVFPTVSDMFNDFSLRSTAGLGLRYNTPVGPVRFEYSWVLDRKPGEDKGQFYFSIGNAF